eukprot:7189636-Pyramimonas_sp.AAC.2
MASTHARPAPASLTDEEATKKLKTAKPQHRQQQRHRPRLRAQSLQGLRGRPYRTATINGSGWPQVMSASRPARAGGPVVH